MKTNVANGIPRREFIRLGSFAVLGAAVLSKAETNLLGATSESGIVPLMGVGYAPSLPLQGYSNPLASANSILSPDPRFISSGARVSVIGAARAASHANAAGGIAVDALFAVSHRRPDDPLRFSFFSINGRTDHDDVTGPISFMIQVPSTGGVPFVVRRLRPTIQKESTEQPSLEPEVAPLTLSLGNVAGPKLTRGVYVLAFREEDSDGMSDWSRMAIARVDTGYVISGATFSYLILNVDYADEVQDRRRALRGSVTGSLQEAAIPHFSPLTVGLAAALC
ncbi:MAG TPA: hypothetical protein VNN25_04050 [Thermoanaerobaculia bacterium]|nr:hypothetical protein [Thermoanaerobaculia bacterium]